MTKTDIIKIIQQHIDLPDEVLDKLAKDLYEKVRPHVPVLTEDNFDAVADFGRKEWEDMLAAVKKLKEVYSTMVPQYTEDIIYIDNLTQLESKISEILFK